MLKCPVILDTKPVAQAFLPVRLSTKRKRHRSSTLGESLRANPLQHHFAYPFFPCATSRPCPTHRTQIKTRAREKSRSKTPVISSSSKRLILQVPSFDRVTNALGVYAPRQKKSDARIPHST